jgi:hypothetical protein
MPRCHASHVSPCLRCLVSLCWAAALAELAEEPTWKCLPAYYMYNTTATSPRYMYLCYYMYPRDHDDASTPTTYAVARRIYNIRSAPLHHLALSLLPPASRSRPQYRVAAQSNTAAGRLHICCMLHSPPRDSGRTYNNKKSVSVSASNLREQAQMTASAN